MKKYTKGFTLIELLVVIAIIGILSAIVLASLNSARAKGQDAAIKGDLSGARAQAELFYSGDGNQYTNVCGTAAAGDGTKSINGAVLAAGQVAGISSVTVNSGAAPTAVAACFASSTAWAASVPLKAQAGYYYCVDSAGNGTTTNGTTLTWSGNHFLCQ